MKRILKLGLFLSFLALLSLAEGGKVYVHNQEMEMDSQSQVSVTHFARLLDSKARKNLKVAGRELILVGVDNQEHRIELSSSYRFSEWERALRILGYESRYNKETGVRDFARAEAFSREETARINDSGSWEQRLERSLRRPGYLRAKTSYEKIVRKIPLSDDEPARARVKRLGKLVADQSPLSIIAWNFDVIRTTTPNALCTGEGHVLVTTGLLDLDLSDDELAGVLGHEIAHGVRRHAELYEERFREFNSIRQSFFALRRELAREESERDGRRIKALRRQLEKKENRFKFIVDYLKNKQDYDQDEEEEADVLGTRYAVAAGFDSGGEARALIKLRNRSVQMFGQSYNEGSRTHPPLERRLKILKLAQSRRKSRY